MASIGDIFLRLVLDDSDFEAQAKMRAERAGAAAGQSFASNLSKQVSLGATQIGRTLDKLGNQMGAAGRSMAMSLTLPIVALGAVSTNLALDFDTAMRKIVGLTDVTADSIDNIREAILRLAPEVGKSPQELAEAFYFVASAGFEAAEAMEVLEVAAKASASGLGDTQTIARTIGAALNAYGKENLSAARATDILIEAVSKGTAEASEFAGSLGRVIPIAAQMDIPFEEVAGALAAMTLSGVDADEAVTALRQILISILKPTRQAEDILTSLGLSAEGLRRQLVEEGLIATLRTLEERFAGNSEATAIMFGNVRALAGVQNLLGLSSQQLDKVMGDVANSVGRLNQAYEETEGPQRDINRAVADLQVSLTTLGDAALPSVVKGIQNLAGFVRGITGWFSRLDEGTQELVVNILGLTAALGPLLIVGGLVAGAFGKMFTAIGFLAGAKGIPLLITQVRALGLANAAAAGAIGLIVAGLVEAAGAWQNYMDEQKPVESSFIRLGVAAGKFYDRIQQAAIKGAKAAGISIEEFKNRVVKYAEETGAGWDTAVRVVSQGLDHIGEASIGMNERWAQAWLDATGQSEAGAHAITDVAARVLEDGSVEVGDAAELAIEDPIGDAINAARDEVATKTRDLINQLVSDLAGTPAEIDDEMQAILDALVDPFTTAERLIKVRGELARGELVTALTSDDPRLEAMTFEQINDWLHQWELADPRIFDIGSGFLPSLTGGMETNLQAAVDWVTQNMGIDFASQFDLAEQLEALGYDGLAAFVRGNEQARLDKLDAEAALRRAQLQRQWNDDRQAAYTAGYNVTTSYGDGLKAAQWYVNDKAQQLKKGLSHFLQYSGSPPYTESREIGEQVGLSWAEGIGRAVRAAADSVRQGVMGVSGALMATPSATLGGAYPATGLSPAAAGAGAGQVANTVNNYNLHVTGRLDVDAAEDALVELQRLQSVSTG